MTRSRVSGGLNCRTAATATFRKGSAFQLAMTTVTLPGTDRRRAVRATIRIEACRIPDAFSCLAHRAALLRTNRHHLQSLCPCARGADKDLAILRSVRDPVEPEEVND